MLDLFYFQATFSDCSEFFDYLFEYFLISERKEKKRVV